MELISFDNTLATLIKTKNDFAKFLRIIVILTQVMFITYYTYELVKLLEHLVYIIIYSFLIVISIVYLVFYLIRTYKTINKPNENNYRIIKRIFRFAKYFLKLGAVSFGVYQIVKTDVTTVMILLTALSIFMLVLNIVSELLVTYFEGTINRFILAFYMDREENTLNKLIVNDLNRDNVIIPNEEELRNKIRADKERFIVKKERTKKEPWIVKKIKRSIEKQINDDEK